MSYSLPLISDVAQLSNEEKIEMLNHLFEPCSVLASFIIARVIEPNPAGFESYRGFIETVRTELMEFLEREESKAKTQGTSINPDIATIIGAHPRLGLKKPEKLSLHSSAEQKSLQAASSEEATKLSALNELYESTFPGLRYVVFVNQRPRSVIMQDMQARIDRNDISRERVEAFNAMCDIAIDRAFKLGAKL